MVGGIISHLGDKETEAQREVYLCPRLYILWGFQTVSTVKNRPVWAEEIKWLLFLKSMHKSFRNLQNHIYSLSYSVPVLYDLKDLCRRLK